MAYVALVIFGLGMTSLATNTDVIDTPGLSAVPGVAGIVVSAAGFSAVLGAGLRVPHPSFYTALWAALAAAVAYLAGVWIAAATSGVDAAMAASVVGRLAVGWAAPVVAVAGFVTAWAAIAVMRTRARPPRWPWERERYRGLSTGNTSGCRGIPHRRHYGRGMERSLETQVSQAVDAWLKWLPRWEPATHRGRIAPCRRCFGSPVLSAAGLGADVPHGVQHGLSTRIKTIVDHSVADYTARNLPMLQAELDQQAARNRARSYRPTEGLEPEFEGLPLDPDPVPGAPFLFTISGLADAADADVPDLPPLSDDAKAALRQEVGLADDYANMVGREVCAVLLHHRLRIQAAIAQYVEPQIEAMLQELAQTLDAPFDPNDPPPVL